MALFSGSPYTEASMHTPAHTCVFWGREVVVGMKSGSPVCVPQENEEPGCAFHDASMPHLEYSSSQHFSDPLTLIPSYLSHSLSECGQVSLPLCASSLPLLVPLITAFPPCQPCLLYLHLLSILIPLFPIYTQIHLLCFCPWI